MTTAIASSGGRCRSVVLTERYARPPRVARTHHRRSHSKLSETQFREGFSAPRYPPNVPPDHPTLDLRPERGSPPPHPTLDLGRQRRWGGGDYEVPPWGGTLARYLPEVPPSPFKGPLLLRDFLQSVDLQVKVRSTGQKHSQRPKFRIERRQSWSE
jgi:hypothetical protein